MRRDKKPDDGRGSPFCGYCGRAMVWSQEWQDGFARSTGEPLWFHQWVCPDWPTNPGKHDGVGRVSVRIRRENDER